MKLINKVVLGLVAVFALGANAQAEEKYAVGIQSGLGSWGISGKVFVDDKITAQALLSNFSLAGRGLYTFKEEDEYNLYAIGELGFWFWNNNSTIDISGGVGIETNWQNFIDDIFPLYWSLEVGLGASMGNTPFGYYGLPIRFGGGVHYRF